MTSPAPGWYPDPQVSAQMRWWDGSTWSADVYERVEPPGGFLAETAPTAATTAATVTTGPTTAPTTPDGVPLATWGRRAVARAIDSVVTGIVGLLAALPWVRDAVRHIIDVTEEQAGRPGANPFGVYDAQTIRNVAIATLVTLVVALAYELVFLVWKSATPGKLLVGLRVRRWAEAGPLGSGVVARRLLGFQVASQVPTFGGIYAIFDVLWPLWDPRRQALHDKIAGTCVVPAHRVDA